MIKFITYFQGRQKPTAKIENIAQPSWKYCGKPGIYWAILGDNTSTLKLKYLPIAPS